MEPKPTNTPLSRRTFLKVLGGTVALGALAETPALTNVWKSFEKPYPIEIETAYNTLISEAKAAKKSAATYIDEPGSRKFRRNLFDSLRYLPSPAPRDMDYSDYITNSGHQIYFTIQLNRYHPPNITHEDQIEANLLGNKTPRFIDGFIKPETLEIEKPNYLISVNSEKLRKIVIVFNGAGEPTISPPTYGQLDKLRNLGYTIVTIGQAGRGDTATVIPKGPTQFMQARENIDKLTFNDHLDGVFVLEYLKASGIVDENCEVGSVGFSYGADQAALFMVAAKELGYNTKGLICASGIYDLLGETDPLSRFNGEWLRISAKTRWSRQELIRRSAQHLLPYAIRNKNFSVPVLSISGDKDEIVDPQKNTLPFAHAIKNDKSSMLIIPELNHNYSTSTQERRGKIKEDLGKWKQLNPEFDFNPYLELSTEELMFKLSGFN